MEVVLQENFPSLGYVGDKVKVKPGYARNYLIPRGIALEISSKNAKLLAHRMSIVAAKKAKLKAQAVDEGKRYEGLILEFNLKIGEKGKSFGSVSTRDIEQSLLAKGFTVEKKQIVVSEQIKAGGDYEVIIKLHSEVSVPVTARVTVERLEVKGEKPARGRRGKKAVEGEEGQEGLEAAAEGSEEGAEKPAKKSKKSAKAKDESEAEDKE